MVDTVETAIYRLRAEGQQQVDALKASVDGLVVSEEKLGQTTERVSSNALQNRLARMDPLIRAQQQYAKELESAKRYVEAGVGTQAQQSAQIELATQRYHQQVTAIKAAAAANENIARSTKLAGHEMVNLGRQGADVFTQLASGQSLFMTAAQQGPQVLDIFATSQARFVDVLKSGVGWLGRFAVSAAGVTTGLLGIGAAAIYMGSSFASAQKDIDRALSGAGAASGLSRGGVNRIADRASSPTGLSISEAREAATAFAATGKIYGDNVERATLLTKDFARAMGIDASEATKRLAKDLQDPVAAAMEWNKTLGFLDAKTLDHIRSLVALGQRQEAVNALMAAAAPSLGKMAQNVDIVTRAYDALGNAISDTFEKWKAFAARSIEKTTGANLGAFSDEDRLTLLRQRRDERSQGPFAQGLDAGPIRALNKEIAELEKKLQGAAAAASEARFGQLSLQANEFTHALIPSIEQVEKLTQAILTLDQYQAGRLSRGMDADPQAESALAVARMQLAIAMEQEGVEVRKAQVFAQNAVAHQNVSATTAQTLAQMNDQLGVAQAVTGAAEIEAQHRATTNQLLAQGKTLVDAIAVADAQRAISLAQVNAEADRMLVNLQQQGQLLQASSQFEKDRIKAAQTYADLIERGVDSERARAVAGQELRNADIARQAQETADAEREAATETERRARAASNAADQEARTAELLDRIVAAAREKARIDAFLPSGIPYSELFTRKDGGKSQFNPEGYTFTTSVATQQSLSGSSYTDPWSEYYATLAGGLGKTGKGISTSLGGGPSLDTDKIASLERLIALMSKEQQIGATQSLIQELTQRTPSLERDESINRLTQSLNQLKEATEANTEALRITTDPLISQGHDYLNNLKIGYYKAASGFDGIARGGTPGVDSIPFRAMVQDGERITITPRGGWGGNTSSVSNDNSRRVVQNITQNISIAGGGRDPRTARQMAQGFIAGAARAAG